MKQANHHKVLIRYHQLRTHKEFLNKLTEIDMNNKYLASLYIKSLYTYIPVDRCIEHLHNYLRKFNFSLPLPISKLIKMSTSYISHNYCQYKNIF